MARRESELRRQADEEVSAAAIVGLGKRIAVAGGRIDDITDNRRILVKDVVDSAAQGPGLVDVPRSREVDVVTLRNLRDDRGKVTLQLRIAAGAFKIHRIEVAPGQRKVPVPWGRPGGLEGAAPSRQG